MTTSPGTGAQPVVVIGHGPVGQTAALLLARWGVPVIALDERAHRDVIGSKSICQQRDVLDVWDSVGAGRAIAEEGVTWTTARTFHRDRELFANEFQDRGEPRFPPFVNISQSRTEQILDERIAVQPLIEARWSHRVTSIVQTRDGATVSGMADDGAFEIRTPWVVMCAGGHCDGLRACLGVEFHGRSHADRFLICDIRTELPDWRTERRFYFDPEWNPGRQVLIHPCPDSTFRIDWPVGEEYDVDAERRTGALDQRIRRIVGDAAYEIVWCSVYRAHSRIADRMSVGRVLLAGDCAHLVTPFGARGLNSGVQDAENAAWKIAYVLRGYAPERLIESYDEERRAAAAENLAITSATMEFLAPETAEQIAYRKRALDAAASDVTARVRVDSGRLAEPYWYVESSLTTPDPSRPFAGRPPKGSTPPPAPGVLLPDVTVHGAEPIPLRTLAREGVTVMRGPDVSAAELESTMLERGTPVRVLDPGQHVRESLGMRDDELWLIRPDAYVAATVRGVDGLIAAHGRLLCTAEPT